MNQIGLHPGSDCPAYLCCVNHYAEITSTVVPSRHTVVFLAEDASGRSTASAFKDLSYLAILIGDVQREAGEIAAIISDAH
ncbi:hypothetical protein FEM03_03890 [Phragmitibacter flavus]|uniref:Uncharacterized protein n=1 Tax=Phragmitibacter flavus TaxID=2576071 RepID=A0A5R8KHT2_9BACT|nr:hypothetical protein [Phragmitibacter flavus]TLD71876.1 hypothetical protein FEM03_03890 [Phragmitibacter flavus]